MRVAAEVSWRLLVFAGTVWVLMRVIGAVSLVVLAFSAALLITALLQPFVALAAAAAVLGESVGWLEIGFAVLVVGIVALGWRMRVVRPA